MTQTFSGSEKISQCIDLFKFCCKTKFKIPLDFTLTVGKEESELRPILYVVEHCKGSWALELVKILVEEGGCDFEGIFDWRAYAIAAKMNRTDIVEYFLTCIFKSGKVHPNSIHSIYFDIKYLYIIIFGPRAFILVRRYVVVQ